MLIAYIQHSVNTDWLFNTKYRVLQADWLILESNEKATLNINREMRLLLGLESSILFLLFQSGCVKCHWMCEMPK